MKDLSYFKDLGGCRFDFASLFVILGMIPLVIIYDLTNLLMTEKTLILTALTQGFHHLIFVKHLEPIVRGPFFPPSR